MTQWKLVPPKDRIVDLLEKDFKTTVLMTKELKGDVEEVKKTMYGQMSISTKR